MRLLDLRIEGQAGRSPKAGIASNSLHGGVFNQPHKVSPDTVALWGEIFRQLPEQAVLWLLDPASEQLKARILRQAAAVGIAVHRVVFAPRCPQQAHLARLQWLNLLLDTWPYNAHTTASDALRAGVPVLTLPQATFASRVDAGILHSAGLSEWVAASPADYVAKAVAFAQRGRAGIDAAKAAVRDAYWASPMVNNPALGRQLEAALLALHEWAVAGEPPTSLRLEADLRLTPLPFGRQADGPIPGSERDPLASAPKALAPVAKPDQPAWAEQLERGSRTARLTNLAVLQREVLGLSAPPVLLDVGRSEPGTHTHDLLAEQQLLIQHKASAADVLDGSQAPWHRYQAPDLGSHLPLRSDWFALFPGYGHWGTLQASDSQSTRSLQGCIPAGSAPVRMAYLDLRGTELQALQHCAELLDDLALIHCKTAPTPLHQGGSSLFELGQWLQQQGYVLHLFTNENKRLFRPFGRDETPFAGSNQLMQLEAVFMPDPLSWSELAEDRLLALAFLAHTLYRSTDVAMLALDRLDRRDRGQRVQALREYLEAAGADA